MLTNDRYIKVGVEIRYKSENIFTSASVSKLAFKISMRTLKEDLSSWITPEFNCVKGKQSM